MNTFNDVAFLMPNRYDTLSHPVRACTARIYLVMCLCFSAVLADVYDRSPNTWALHVDIHGHLFLHIKRNQQNTCIGIVAYYHNVTCMLPTPFDQVMYDYDIGFFVVCFIYSLWRVELFHTCTGVRYFSVITSLV